MALLQDYINGTQELAEILEQWKSGEPVDPDSTEPYGVKNALSEMGMYEHAIEGECNNRNEALLTSVHNAEQIESVLPDFDANNRVDRRSDDLQLSNHSFCIDSTEAKIIGKSVSFNSTTGMFSVHVSDVVRYFMPAAPNDGLQMIRRNLLKGATIHGIDHVQEMFPKSFAEEYLSLLGSKCAGDVVTVTFSVEVGGRITLGAVELAHISKPIRVSLEECEAMLNEVSEENLPECEENCELISCYRCKCHHFARMHDILMQFRSRRLGTGEGFYRNDYVDLIPELCFSRWPSILRRRNAVEGQGQDDMKVLFKPYKSAYVGQANRLVEEAMVASAHALSLYCTARSVEIIRRGHLSETPREFGDTDLDLTVGSFELSRRELANRTEGVNGLVPWTNPVGDAVDYVNQFLIHLHIRLGTDTESLHYFIERFEGYVRVPNILDYVGMLASRAQVVRQFYDEIKHTCAFQYFRDIVKQQMGMARSRKKTFKVTFWSLISREDNYWEGRMRFDSYGWVLNNAAGKVSFRIENDALLLPPPQSIPVLGVPDEEHEVRARVVIEAVDVEGNSMVVRLCSVE